MLKEREEITKDYEYFALYSQNKWGIINQEGEVVIQPSYEEMIVIPDKTKDVFICIYNVNEETGTYQTKAINSKDETILTGYEQIEALDNIDKNSNVWYEENVLRIKKNGKYGLIDLNGKELLPAEYDEITVLEGIENSLIIKKDGKVGLVNDTGSVIIDANYKEIKGLGDTYKDGYITIDEQGKYGLISATKKQILENKYDEILQVPLKEYYAIKENGKQKLINSNGEVLIDSGFDEIKSTTTNGIIFVKDNLYGEMNTSGEVTIKADYQELKEVKEQIYIAKQNNKYGIIDGLGNGLTAFEYDGMTYNEKADLFFADDSEYKTSIIDNKYDVKTTGILSEVNTDEEMAEKYAREHIEDFVEKIKSALL